VQEIDQEREFSYGRVMIGYRLLFSERKTLEIAVHPDGALHVKAPLLTDLSVIESKLKKRARWILRQRLFFQQFVPRTPLRCYVNGETHLYLGKQYRLKCMQGSRNEVKLLRGMLQVTVRNKMNPENVKVQLEKWYREKAALQFVSSFERCWLKISKLGLPKPKLSIRQMKYRWGSLSGNGTLTMNLQLIRAPRECIDYVMIHEFCHLKHPTHCKGFYDFLSSLCPNWKQLKLKLEHLLK
jgi:predicted metal-dependent hydrolase